MLKNITLSAEETLIERARRRAAAENTTLNAEFRQWLAKYAQSVHDTEGFLELMAEFGYVNAGRKFTREALNER